MIKLKNDNIQLQQEEITYATIQHLHNSIVKKDSRSNNELRSISSSYPDDFIELFDKVDSPLSNLNDDFYDLYKFCLTHIKKIVENPKKKMITVDLMVDKNRIKRINSQTVNWICQKPGPTVRHKLANIKNVKSTKKINTLNTKPNQVVKVCIERLKLIIKQRDDMYKTFPKLFNNKDLSSELRELSKLYKVFEEVDSVIHLDTDNTLLGNKHYNAVWKSYKKLKNVKTETYNQLEVLCSIIKLSILSSKNVEHINNYSFFDSKFNCKMFINNNRELTEFEVNLIEDTIVINSKFFKFNETWYIDREINYTYKFIKVHSDDIRGQAYEVISDNKFLFNFDLIGVKTLVLEILKKINLDINNNNNKNLEKVNVDFYSINSYDNVIYPLPQHQILVKYDSYYDMLDSSIYDISEDKLENITVLNELEKNDYNVLLTKSKDYIKRNDIVIYDVRDDVDEFSTVLRSNFQNNISSSFPVWRSILAVETFGDSNIDSVVDLCGNNYYTTSVSFNTEENIYIHNGQSNNKGNYFSEYEFLSNYLFKYSQKYNVNISKQMGHIISSGKLSKLLNDKNDELITYVIDDEFISIFYDEEIFEELLEEISYEDNDELFIIPNFLFNVIDVSNKVSNLDLSKGGNIIVNKFSFDKTKPCWYERLADLSLEVNKNGYYDSIELIHNQNIANIIGKPQVFIVEEHFTIPANQHKIRLPLLKSNLHDNDVINYDAQLPSKYFPLEKDVKTKLTLTYSYNNENMYELKFEPITEAPFKELIVEWKQREYSTNIINPEIRPKPISTSDLIKKQNDFISFINKLSINNYSNKILKKYDYNLLFFNQNSFQNLRILHPNIASELLNYALGKHVIEKLKEIYKGIKSFKFDNPMTKETFVERLIGFLIVIDPTSSKYFNDKNDKIDFYLHYGRYLAFAFSNDLIKEKYEDKDMNIVLSHMKDFITRLIYSDNKRFDGRRKEDVLSKFISGLTSASMINPKVILDISYKNESLAKDIVYSVLALLENVLFELQEALENKQGNNRIHKSITYNIKHILEITFAILYLRDSYYFKDLRPDGVTSNKFVKYFKELNKLYYIYDKQVRDSLSNKTDAPKLQTIETKYKLSIPSINEGLNNVYKEIYCLILFFTGQEDANHIKIVQEDK